jgi:hypothetical protein
MYIKKKALWALAQCAFLLTEQWLAVILILIVFLSFFDELD